MTFSSKFIHFEYTTRTGLCTKLRTNISNNPIDIRTNTCVNSRNTDCSAIFWSVRNNASTIPVRTQWISLIASHELQTRKFQWINFSMPRKQNIFMMISYGSARITATWVLASNTTGTQMIIRNCLSYVTALAARIWHSRYFDFQFNVTICT